jgi:hypothetical protein
MQNLTLYRMQIVYDKFAVQSSSRRNWSRPEERNVRVDDFSSYRRSGAPLRDLGFDPQPGLSSLFLQGKRSRGTWFCKARTLM